MQFSNHCVARQAKASALRRCNQVFGASAIPVTACFGLPVLRSRRVACQTPTRNNRLGAVVEVFANNAIGLQGTEDQVVPPNQAQKMYDAIKAKNIATALVMFEGEQHGFRSAQAIRRALDGEFFFYGRVLGFKSDMPRDLPTVDIANI